MLSVDSGDSYIGTRWVSVYAPAGAWENPRPVYDLAFATDVAEDLGIPGAFARILDRLFDEDEVSDAVLVGFGDFLVDPVHQDQNEDRDNLLTMVRLLRNSLSAH